jgi:hypothetical protein
MTAPTRCSFSLRTLFVTVTVLGTTLGWLTCQIHWVSQRHAVLEKQVPTTWGTHSSAAKPNWQLRLLREQPVAYILVGVGVDSRELGRITALFPEATVARMNNFDEQDKNVYVCLDSGIDHVD